MAKTNVLKEIQDDDPEVKREMKVQTISIKEGILERLESLISDWMIMKSVVAWILNYKKMLSSRVRQNSVKIFPKIGPHFSLLEEAQQEIMRLYQQQVTVVLILWKHKKNWKRHTKKWIIRRLDSSFRTLVQIISIGTGIMCSRLQDCKL